MCTARVRARREPGEDHAPRQFSTPGVGSVVAAATGTVVSLAPELLARTSTAQGLLTGVLVAVFVGVHAGVRMMLRRGQFSANR